MASLVEQRFVEEILTNEGVRLLTNQEAAFAARLRLEKKRINRQGEEVCNAEFRAVSTDNIFFTFSPK